MERFLVIYRGAPDGSADAPELHPERWRAWLDALGSAVVDRGGMSVGAVEIPSRLLGPKESTSSLSGYAIVTAQDFNDVVRLVEACPIFDAQGSVEIARLSGPPG